jgi:hypothetical protein
MLHLLRRHPVPIQAFFNYSLALTFALPVDALEPLLPPGLALDTWRGHGFLAIALVDTAGLRPVGAPRFLGQDFFLVGYRVFARARNAADGSASALRGLRILRSDANRVRMVVGGNLLTRYAYRLARVDVSADGGRLEIRVRTRGGTADLHVVAHTDSTCTAPLDASPLRTAAEARRFAGPLPYTFDYEPETGSIIAIRAIRDRWDPRPIRVQVHEAAFLEQRRFAGVQPVLASAFYVHDVRYRWQRGRVLRPQGGGRG